jgi:phage terminase large subunit-like protein
MRIRLAITAYATHRADRIVAEVNNGGDMVGATLRMVDPNVAFSAVRASRGKVVRAEPVAAPTSRAASITSAPSRNSKTR